MSAWFRFVLRANQKTDRTEFARRDIFQPDGVMVLVVIKPHDRVGELQPRAIAALQCEIAHEITHARDRENFHLRKSGNGTKRVGDFRRRLWV